MTDLCRATNAPRRRPQPRSFGPEAALPHPPGRRLLAVGQAGLRHRLVDAVFRLGLGEPGAVARRKLLDQAGSAESLPVAEVALGGVDGLRVPVGVQVTDGVVALRRGEPLARRGRKLLEQPLLAEALPFAEVAVGGVNGLLIPVRLEVFDGKLGVRLRETLAEARGELVQQSLLAESLPFAEVALGRINGLLLPARHRRGSGRARSRAGGG